MVLRPDLGNYGGGRGTRDSRRQGGHREGWKQTYRQDLLRSCPLEGIFVVSRRGRRPHRRPNHRLSEGAFLCGAAVIRSLAPDNRDVVGVWWGFGRGRGPTFHARERDPCR